ncbi:MAG: CHAT domain-containing protein, partial [Hyphomicrobiaceae bacterium]
HGEVGKILNNLAELYSGKWRYSEAEPRYKRALAIAEKNFGPDHPDVGTGLTNLAGLYYGQGQWDRSLFYLDKGTQVYARRSGRAGSAELAGQVKNSAQREGLSFKILVKAAYRLAKTQRENRADLGRKTFEHLQWTAGAGASAGLSQMAVRFGAGNGRLAALVRERQDLGKQWQTADEKLVAAKSQSPAQRNEPLENTLQSRLAQIDERTAEIDAIFKDEFPDYAALARSEPLSIEQVQDHLHDDEVLIYFIDTPEWQNTPEESFIWVVTKTSVKWIRSALGTKALETMVSSLRCGLDAVGWDDEQRAGDCNRLLKINYSASRYRDGEPLPFDANLAHELYDRLFGEIETDIKDKKLLLVLSGPVTSLPFQILVTEEPKPGTDYGQINWLIDRHQLTVLPSVASRKALRRTSRPSQATMPFFGIGNPLLLGKSGRDKRAWKKQTCSFKEKLKPLKVAGYNVPELIAKYFRGGQVDVDALRAQPPLPETADELCAVAKMTGATTDAVKLGSHATETHIKKLSADGVLKKARVIHFATHGLLAGETASLVKSKAEPSLMLTPPQKATDTDDGLLTASEVAQLKLDADWVILSACNTAGGEKPGAETMSGLAKAFFYAGARSLLVSHWYVNSDATVQLITRSFEALRREPRLGRAGALRVAMRDLIGSKQYSHPEYWAPFIVVGEGR